MVYAERYCAMDLNCSTYLENLVLQAYNALHLTHASELWYMGHQSPTFLTDRNNLSLFGAGLFDFSSAVTIAP